MNGTKVEGAKALCTLTVLDLNFDLFSPFLFLFFSFCRKHLIFFLMVNCIASGCEKQARKSCAKCKSSTLYCSRDCQQAHWKIHKKLCCVTSYPSSSRSDFIEAKQHGSVRMTSGGVVPGVCTVGLGPCVALIFHSSTRISLTHTP
jgi:hypothetical protein